MIKVLIIQGELMDEFASTICYYFPDMEAAKPHIEEAIEQGCWACITEAEDER